MPRRIASTLLALGLLTATGSGAVAIARSVSTSPEPLYISPQRAGRHLRFARRRVDRLAVSNAGRGASSRLDAGVDLAEDDKPQQRRTCVERLRHRHAVQCSQRAELELDVDAGWRTRL